MTDAPIPPDTTGPTLEQILRPSGWRYWGFLLIALIFVLIGGFMIRAGAPMGWLVTGSFGLGTAGLSFLTLPGASYLRLDPQGFTICTFYRKHPIRWSDVAGFGIATTGLNETVGFDYVPGYRRRAHGRALAVAISGFEAALPSTYGMTAKELAALLT
jgi:hypothetical protein